MKGTPMLRVDTATWHRDSHDLFDYETGQVNVKKFYLNRAVEFFRSGTEVICVVEGANPPESADYLLSIKYHSDGRFIVIPADWNVLSNNCKLKPKKLWMIVRDMPDNKYILQENDVVKLGRFKLRVRQLVKNVDVTPELKLDSCENPSALINSEESKTGQCRICLLEGSSKENPLISPCQCKGSIQYVHVDCISVWVNAGQNITEKDSKSSFFIKQVQCELCKSAFPASVIYGGERIRIVKVPKTTPPFMLLENLNSHKGIHVVSMAEKKDLKLGRGHESDVRIPDVSISRYHATIRFVNGAFQLEDHHSKFGTLVALRKAHAIDHSGSMAVQAGRSVVNICIDNNAPSSENLMTDSGRFMPYCKAHNAILPNQTNFDSTNKFDDSSTSNSYAPNGQDSRTSYNKNQSNERQNSDGNVAISCLPNNFVPPRWNLVRFPNLESTVTFLTNISQEASLACENRRRAIGRTLILMSRNPFPFNSVAACQPGNTQGSSLNNDENFDQMKSKPSVYNHL